MKLEVSVQTTLPLRYHEARSRVGRFIILSLLLSTLLRKARKLGHPLQGNKVEMDLTYFFPSLLLIYYVRSLTFLIFHYLVTEKKKRKSFIDIENQKHAFSPNYMRGSSEYIWFKSLSLILLVLSFECKLQFAFDF